MRNALPKIESQIYSSTTRKYALALVLVAGLSLTAYLTMHTIIFEQEQQASLINRSGRQRMLSQRMALLSEVMASGDQAAQSGIAEELHHSVDLFSSSHEALTNELATSATAIPELKETYFGAGAHLDRDVKNFASLINQLLAPGIAPAARQTLVAAIRQESVHSILPKLDAVVTIQQRYSERQVARLRELETAILFFTIILLLIEAIFIFRPMANSISRLLLEAREAQEAAILATNQKSAFLATITHEIRTPLVGVTGILEHLLLGQMTKDQRDQLRTLSNLSDNLVSLVNDILDYSKIEAGKLNFEIVEFDVEETIADTEKLFRSAANAKSIALVTEIAPEVPAVLRCDPVRLRQVLTNFVGNALKFTPPGGKISIRVLRSGADGGGRRCPLRVEVTDTGVGLSTEAQQRLFKRYSQADDSVAKKYGGTGLGLSICKQIVEQFGGRIGVISQEGQGSTFWFEIEMEMADLCLLRRHESQPSAPCLEGKTVLLAEDNEVNREVLLRQLRKLGATTFAARDGQEALTAAELRQFDIILMDCEMPVMDGFAATLRLRALERERKLPRALVVAMTGHKGDEATRKCLDAGMDALLCKPIKNQALGEALGNLLLKAKAG